jgi:hypothetical protein
VTVEYQPFESNFTQSVADLIVPIQQDEFGIAVDTTFYQYNL